MNTLPSSFNITTYGKWILTGEHAVLRGHPVILFPVKTRCLSLSYQPTDDEIRAEFSGDFGDEMQFLFWGAFERAIEILNIPHNRLTGKIAIDNQIPVATGMGSSAALCVAVGRLLVHLGHFAEGNLLEFSRQLENLFHGESSGGDIAVSIAGSGIYFSRSGGMHPIEMAWQPTWFLSYSGCISATARTVKKVKHLWQTDATLAGQIDENMAHSVSLAEKALKLPKTEGLPMLAESIHTALNCFKAWDLCDGILAEHIRRLTEHGALAAKPTGKGDGGFVLSLWNEAPPEALREILIPL